MFKGRFKTQLAMCAAGAIVMAWLVAAPPSSASVAQPSHSVRTTGAANAVLRREVFGFADYFNLGDPNVGYPSWHMNLLTTIAFFRLQVNSGNGYIVPAPDPGWNMFHSSTMTNFVNTAHSSGVRVIVSVNLHDMSTSPTNQVCTGLLKANYANTISETLQLIQQAGIDGVNLNYEATNVSCALPNPDPDNNPVGSRDRFTAFVAAFRQAMPNGYIAIDTFSGAAEDNLEFFNVTGLAPNVDSMFVMAYDMDWANYFELPLQCSSYCFNPVSPLNTYRFNVTKSMQQYTALVPASKVILGQPLYGSRGCVASSSPAHQYLTRDYVNTTYIYASTIASQTGVSQLTTHRDPADGVSEWDTWWDTDWNCWREQYFDDVTSLAAKYDVVNANNLRGVGFFTLDYGGGSPELWNLLENKFATTTPWYSLGGVLTSSAATSSWGTTRTDVFVRGSDNALWHRSWDGTTWANWESLGGTLTANPAAVSWGPNRIDVFVRGTDSAIWHRSWNGTTWASWDSVGGIATSAASATSWGTGRLDIVVRGTNNGLWHRSWNGGTWGAWDAVGGVATSDPSMVASGTGRVDVFVRGTDNALWHRSGDGAGSWTAWESLGGILLGSPAAASCAPGHLDVFVQGTDYGLWQKSLNGTPWSIWTSLRGYWTTGPAAVCVTGTTNVNLFEGGPDSALWQTITPGT
jgi:spore germination protein YaaH